MTCPSAVMYFLLILYPTAALLSCILSPMFRSALQVALNDRPEGRPLSRRSVCFALYGCTAALNRLILSSIPGVLTAGLAFRLEGMTGLPAACRLALLLLGGLLLLLGGIFSLLSAARLIPTAFLIAFDRSLSPMKAHRLVRRAMSGRTAGVCMLAVLFPPVCFSRRWRIAAGQYTKRLIKNYEIRKCR